MIRIPTKRKVLYALRESIYHWHENLLVQLSGIGLTYEDTRGKKCKCCILFRIRTSSRCPRCPVRRYTGSTVCLGTPWAWATHGGVRGITAEINFLQTIHDYVAALKPKEFRKFMTRSKGIPVNSRKWES